MFAYPCPYCGHRLLATPERTGQRTICSKCLTPIVIPAPEGAATTINVSSATNGQAAPANVAADIIELAATEPDPPFVGSVVIDDDLPLPPPPLPAPVPVLPPRVTLPSSIRPPSRPDLPPIADTPPPVAANPRYARPSRLSGARVAPADDHRGMIVFSPTGMDSVDAAAELTAAISMRMRPPPEPPSDLKLSTGLWLTLSAVGLSLWVFSLVYNPDARVYTALIGAVETIFGYGWIVYLAGRRGGFAKGLTAAFPPVALNFLFRPIWSPRYRPLRFFGTGLILMALAAIAPFLQPVAHQVVGLDDSPPPPPKLTPPTFAARLRDALASGNEQRLVDELAALASKATQVDTTLTADDRTVVVARLRELTQSESPDVRVAALKALAAWAQEDSQPEVLAALRSRDETERRMALRICERWRVPKVVQAVAARLAVRDDSLEAEQVLLAIARASTKELVEDALLPLLGTDDSNLRSALRQITKDVGGDRTETRLKELRAAATRPDAQKDYDRWLRDLTKPQGK